MAEGRFRSGLACRVSVGRVETTLVVGEASRWGLRYEVRVVCAGTYIGSRG